MKKSMIITIVFAILFLTVSLITVKADSNNRVVLTNCESMNGWSTAGAGLDDTTRVQGKYSYSVTSVWPNAKFNIDKTIVQNSGIAFEDAYFEYYIYVQDITKHTKSGYFKLSSDYNFSDANGNDANEKNIFKWSFSSINIKTGWNFFSVKFSEMEYVLDSLNPLEKTAVYQNLSKFYYVDPAKNIPGATGQILDTMYMLKVNIDAMAISNTYRTIEQENIPIYSTVRYGDVEYTNGFFWSERVSSQTNTELTETLIIISSGVVLLAAVIFVMLIFKKKMKGERL